MKQYFLIQLYWQKLSLRTSASQTRCYTIRMFSISTLFLHVLILIHPAEDQMQFIISTSRYFSWQLKECLFSLLKKASIMVYICVCSLHQLSDREEGRLRSSVLVDDSGESFMGTSSATRSCCHCVSNQMCWRKWSMFQNMALTVRATPETIRHVHNYLLKLNMYDLGSVCPAATITSVNVICFVLQATELSMVQLPDGWLISVRTFEALHKWVIWLCVSCQRKAIWNVYCFSGN